MQRFSSSAASSSTGRAERPATSNDPSTYRDKLRSAERPANSTTPSEPRSAEQPASNHGYSSAALRNTSMETKKAIHPDACSAGQPARNPQRRIPSTLENTPLGNTLLDRMESDRWQPLVLHDVPENWLPVLQRMPPPTQVGGYSVAVIMPDDHACWMYQTWWHKKHVPDRLAIAIMLESTQSFIEAYGQDRYRRTLLSLAAHGKPAAILVQVWPTL